MSLDVSRLDEMPLEVINEVISHMKVKDAMEFSRSLGGLTFLYNFISPHCESGEKRKKAFEEALVVLPFDKLTCQEFKQQYLHIEEVVKKNPTFYRERFLESFHKCQGYYQNTGIDLRVPSCFKKDREYILAAMIAVDDLAIRKEILAKADPALLQDGDLIALSNGRSLRHQDLFASSFRAWGGDFWRADFFIKNDMSCAKAAVMKDYRNYRFCSHALQQDKELALFALFLNRHLYQELPDSLKSDKDVVLMALSKDSRFEFGAKAVWCEIPDSLKSDKDVALAAVKLMPELYQFLSAELKKDVCIARAALSYQGAVSMYHFLPDELKNDRELALLAAKHNGSAFAFMKEEFKKDEKIALLAVSSKGDIIKVLSKDLQKNRKIALAAVKQDPFAVYHLKDVFSKEEMRFLVEVAVKKTPHVLQILSKKDPAFMDEVSVTNPEYIKYAAQELFEDKSFIKALVTKQPLVYHHLPTYLQEDPAIKYIASSHRELSHLRQAVSPSLLEIEEGFVGPLGCAVM